jgi:hypothetical protein
MAENTLYFGDNLKILRQYSFPERSRLLTEALAN